MTGKKRSSGIFIALILLAAMFCSCGGNDAEAKAGEELDRLKSSETAASSLDAVKEALPQDAGEDFDAFLAKVRDFDYEIIGSEAVSEEGEELTIVDVKITSYDFGREYISTWKDYLKTHKNASAGDAEGQEFYKALFSRLSKLEDKNHISFVEIRVTETEDGLTSDIQTNEELQDALFGGMISEMKTLAEG